MNSIKPKATIFLGAADPAIPDINITKEKWKRFVNITQLIIVPDGSHYFIKTHSKYMEHLIDSYIN